MNKRKIGFTSFVTLCCISFSLFNAAFANEEARPSYKYPDYGYMYVGNDKFENFNRKIFNFNLKLNKYAIRPVHTVWASVMPEYGIERIQCATSNIEYPIRLVSTLIQKDFGATKTETMRFLTNTTIGLGGLYDPAKSLFKIKPVSENMEQALASCHMKQGPYLVIPVLNSTSPRNIMGRILDAGLNPSSYIATPVLALIKAGILVNRTSSMQPLSKMLESTYADPYDIAKKLYGLDTYIKCANLDREEVLYGTNKDTVETVENTDNDVNLADTELNVKNKSEELTVNDILQGEANIDNVILKSYNLNNSKLMADMILFDYNPQNPVVDAMRTALFDLPGIDDSIWTELSIWNRCFAKKIKTSSVNFTQGRDDYKFKYILQKDKNAPLAIIYPSIGEGMSSHHSIVLGKLFYDEGYSVVMLSSHFQWEFVKSMPENYRPGVPSKDAEYVQELTHKIIDSLQAKYACQFSDKVVIGTSFGALMTLFVADKEYHNNTMNISKFISINPPIELLYAMKQIDKNNEEWNKNPAQLKERVGVTAAKVLQMYNSKEDIDKNSVTLPFSEEEGKLITGFLMHQKLSDLVYTIENGPKSDKKEVYNILNNISYQDYAQKYLLNEYEDSIEDLNERTSLFSIKDFLANNDNYKIYHTLDDYLVNQSQLKKLKQISGKNTLLIDHGSHLGYLYREEFINELRKDITLKNSQLAIIE